MESLCLPRRISRARSAKPSTVRTRKNEASRSGLSAAILKINGKWRQRKSKAIQRLMSTEWYQQLLQMSPTSCKLHLETLKNDFDTLREKEIEFYKEELVNNQATVENDDCTPAVVLNKSYSNT